MEKKPEEPVVEAPAEIDEGGQELEEEGEEKDAVICQDCNEECEDRWWVGGVSKRIYCEACWEYLEDRQCHPNLRSRGHKYHCDICEAHDHADLFIIHKKTDGSPHCKICSSPLMIEKHERRY